MDAVATVHAGLHPSKALTTLTVIPTGTARTPGAVAIYVHRTPVEKPHALNFVNDIRCLGSSWLRHPTGSTRRSSRSDFAKEQRRARHIGLGFLPASAAIYGNRQDDDAGID